MNRLQLTYVVSILILSVALSRGLDRLIVDPVSTTPNGIAQSPVEPAQVLPSPSTAQTTAAPGYALDQEQRILISRDGHYYADVEINGWQGKRMLIDTGATYVVLSWEDAASIGIDPAPEEFNHETRTANGTGHVALANLREVRLGDIVLENVQAAIGEPGMLEISLLGMSFLSRLSKVETTDKILALRQ